jgi:hypothetical protein
LQPSQERIAFNFDQKNQVANQRNFIIILIALLLLYIISSFLLLLMGYLPLFQWYFILYIAACGVPFAYIITCSVFYLRRLVQFPNYLQFSTFIAIGLLLLLCFNPQIYLSIYVSLFLLTVAFWHIIKFNHELIKPLLTIMLIYFVGYNTVWNLNYVALNLIINRHLYDPFFLKIDLYLYSLLYGHAISQINMFPLSKSNAIFYILENSYIILIPELFIVAILLLLKDGRIAQYIIAIFSCYLIGLAIFIIFPALGPFIYYSETFQSAYKHTLTYSTMQMMDSGYKSIKHGLQFNTIGYFVSMPSLHVATAVVAQWFMAISKIHFWCFLSINFLIIVSTCYLGYHYLIDIPTGILLALTVLFSLNYVGRRRNNV